MTFSPRIPIIYGGGGIGAPGTHCKLTEAASAQAVFDEFCKYGPMSIDTSRLYGHGTSEGIIGQLNLHGSRIDTKVYPIAPGDHSASKIKEHFAKSVEALNGNKIRVFYLHAPDRTVPWEETLKAINDLHLQGSFDVFGLSNYKSYEVAEIVMICRAKGWITPAVYEGIYNPIDRTVETELIPCLRHFGIHFAAYCPLAGGFLVGHLLSPEALKNPEPGSHFDASLPFGTFFRERYGSMIEAVSSLRSTCASFLPPSPYFSYSRSIQEKHGLTLNQASVRWMEHHSVMIPSDHGIIYGASKASQAKATLQYANEGPLPDAVVRAYNECYAKVKGGLPNYHHDPAWYKPEVHGV
ncbi:aflatoxin B1-aldehyde reductase [Flagelloscypha sp. PMI_526]|nr:aflatoxin B1-aldehyde reductase [Flagelloscypha sp. PMI_526]